MSSSLRALRAVCRTPATRAFGTTAARAAGASMARMTLIGNLVATPESVQTASGRTVFRYTIAVNPPVSRAAAAAAAAASEDPSSTSPASDPSYYNIAAYVGPGEEGSPRAQLLAALPKGTLCYVEADGRMVTLEPRDGEERGRRVLNLTQRTIQILSPKQASS